MATILVCDLCESREDVRTVDTIDLCADCAFDTLGKIVALEIPAIQEAMNRQRVADGQTPKPFQAPAKPAAKASEPESPPGVTVLTDEAKAKQRRATLFHQHQTVIYEIILPKAPSDLPWITKYGAPGEEATVQVLEAVPGKAGRFFAKMVA